MTEKKKSQKKVPKKDLRTDVEKLEEKLDKVESEETYLVTGSAQVVLKVRYSCKKGQEKQALVRYLSALNLVMNAEMLPTDVEPSFEYVPLKEG